MATIKSINEHDSAPLYSANTYNVLVENANGNQHLKTQLSYSGLGIIANNFDTSSKGYGVGEIFFYDGLLYEVTEIISINETFDSNKAIQVTLNDLRPKYTQITLTAANWSDNEQTVNVSGITENSNVFVSIAPLSISEGVNCGVYCLSQATGSLTFSCETVPQTDIEVNLRIEN